MDEDEEDVKKMNDFISKQKSEFKDNFQLEYENFINFKTDWDDLDLDDDILITPNLDAPKYPPISEIPSSTLTEDEQITINSCSDPDLKKLLTLNRSKNMQLIKIYKKMQQLLVQCETAMEEKNGILKTQPPKQTLHHTNIWKLAAPYFKDKQFFPCPINDDTKEKRRNNELSVYDSTPSLKWRPEGFNRLLNAIKCNYNVNRQNDVVRKISVLRAKGEDDNCEEVLELKRQLEVLKSSDEIPPLGSNEFINWYKVSETFFNDRHTPSECQAVWHMLVHPDINKSEWNQEENGRLEEIVKRYNQQNWEAITDELENNRTAFTTCLHYFSKLCGKFHRAKFTPEEDARLLEAIEMHKMGSYIPWHKVVCHFENRSKHQLYHRFFYFLTRKDRKVGKFSEAEDILLIILVNKFGRNYRKCAEFMPHRSPIQLKNRYLSNLQRQIKKGTFTAEDDVAIYAHVQKHGEKKWSSLGETLNRCNAQIRQRYKCIKAYKLVNPDADIADVPKRKHSFEDPEDQYSFLHYVADQYKNADFVPNIEMIEENLQMEMGGSDKGRSIDSLLTDFFKSSMETERIKAITDENLDAAADNTSKVLSLLEADLEIPSELESGDLDNVDLEVLVRLGKRGAVKPTTGVLVAPNVNTLVGLRGLIIKNKEYKSKLKNKCSIDKDLFKCGDEALFHRDLFSKRFHKLFEWSAFLSLEKPKKDEVADTASNSKCSNVISYDRRKVRNEGEVVAKKRKIDLTEVCSTKYSKMVDRRVVEN